MTYQFFSWNVDGYTETIHNWLQSYLEENGPDVVFLSETKKPESVLRQYFDQFSHYQYIINAHDPSKYHGVAMLIKKPHHYVQIPIQMNISTRKDTKSPEAANGRIIVIQLNGRLNVIGSYTPNSGRYFDYRITIWDPAFFYLLGLLKANGPTLWMGDINVALTNLDVSDPNDMSTWPGFTLPERINFQALLNSGWIDPWRLQHPQMRDYSWVGRLRRPNYGMRIDNIIISDNLLPNVEDTYILSDVTTDTDHLPVIAYIKA